MNTRSLTMVFLYPRRNVHGATKILVLSIFLQMWLGPETLQSQDAPPFHTDVGQTFKPSDIDWENPIYSTSFDQTGSLEDWSLEGGKQASIIDGKLVLESNPAPEGRLPRRNPNHLVYWLKKEVPADFLLEFSVRPKDPTFGLNIVFFNARGKRGQSIFDPTLEPRDGTFQQYHSGDLNNYHISYWAGDRGSSNIRKNAGFHLVGSGKDPICEELRGQFQTVRIYKRGGMIRLMVNDEIAAAFDDDGKTFGPVHTHTGWIGLRQMGRTIRCEYDHFSVYPLLEGRNPDADETTVRASTSGVSSAQLSANASSFELDKQKYYDAVRWHIHMAMKYGWDKTQSDYRLSDGRLVPNKVRTPLFADHLQVNPPHVPSHWIISQQIQNQAGYPPEAISSNFVQNLWFASILREFSRLTGEKKYEGMATDIVDFGMGLMSLDEDGILTGGLIDRSSRLAIWGNHATLDLIHDKYFGLCGSNVGTKANPRFPTHELYERMNIPFMHERNPQTLKAYIEAFCDATTLNWETLRYTRHLGKKDGVFWKDGDAWDKTHLIEENQTVPTDNGNSPDYAGYTTMHLAFWHYRLYDEERSWKLAYQMTKRFMDARDTDTKLGPMSYINRNDQYNKDVDGRGHRYSAGILTLLKVVENVLDRPEDRDRRKLILNLAIEELNAFGKHMLVAQTGRQYEMDIDGTNKRQGERIEEDTLWAYTLAFRLAEDPDQKRHMWNHARSILKGYGVGDIGDATGNGAKIPFTNYQLQPAKGEASQRLPKNNKNAYVIHALLELYRSTERLVYLEKADDVMDRIMEELFHNGLFVRQENGLYGRIGDYHVMALVDLLAAIEGKALHPTSIPVGIFAFRPKNVVVPEGEDVNDNRVFYTKTGRITRVPMPDFGN